MEDTQQIVWRRSRIGERPENVEDRAHTEFLADGGNVLHGRMVVGREHEADAALSDAGSDLLTVQHDVGAQRLQHISCTRLGGHASVAVLGDGAPCSGHHEHDGGGDVEGVRTVTAGAHDVDEVATISHVDRVGELAHDLGSGRDLTDGLLLDAQAGQDGRRHDRRDLALHDHAHQVQHFVMEDFPVVDDALEGVLRRDAHDGGWFVVVQMTAAACPRQPRGEGLPGDVRPGGPGRSSAWHGHVRFRWIRGGTARPRC